MEFRYITDLQKHPFQLKTGSSNAVNIDPDL